MTRIRSTYVLLEVRRWGRLCYLSVIAAGYYGSYSQNIKPNNLERDKNPEEGGPGGPPMGEGGGAARTASARRVTEVPKAIDFLIEGTASRN